ncbi:hypothetical protein SAMN05661096_00216 [Marivirga sericea]|uniref:Uncharacterized protein n=1 Tax=Marivirga sericea TaxID=1028 RepID=A0A1X7I4K2_9BACT|nr:hypothetical protein [Marivirga sericea]SMG09453.1 hypothetical protein SAMN05661096_00216 [Marivirga sericea]
MKKLTKETITFIESSRLTEKYSKLLEKHSVVNTMSAHDVEEVEKLIIKNGYPNSKYLSDENYYLLEQSDISEFKLSTKGGLVEFILTVKRHNISFAGNFGFIVYMAGQGAMFKKPSFSSYEELEEILVEGFGIYEDIKKGLSKSQA